MLEVEVKIPVAEPGPLLRRLDAEQAKEMPSQHQHDTYFEHPCRDLKAADEAFRLRREGERFELTHKGPRQDAAAKVREEHNLAIGTDPTALLEALGFRQAVDVHKHRRMWDLDGAIVALDEVEGLGTYVEIEIIDGDVDDVRAVASLLGLDPDDAEPRSYVELLEE